MYKPQLVQASRNPSYLLQKQSELYVVEEVYDAQHESLLRFDLDFNDRGFPSLSSKKSMCTQGG